MIFIVEKDINGGYNAKAVNESIFTQADTLGQLNLNIAEAIECHFDDGRLPAFDLQFISDK